MKDPNKTPIFPNYLQHSTVTFDFFFYPKAISHIFITVFTMALCLFTSSAFSQVDLGDDDLVNLDTIMSYEPQDMARIADSCRYPMVVNAATVRYQSSARVLLEFGGDFIPSTFTLKNLLTSMTVPYQLFPRNNSIVLNNLALNNQYVVVAKNSCGISSAAYVINTSKPTEPAIFVSDKMMDALNDQIKNHSNTPFYTYLGIRPDLPMLERIAFIQQYFLKDALIPDIYQNMLPPVTPRGERDCDCREVQTLSHAIDGNQKQVSTNAGFIFPVQVGNGNNKKSLGKNARSWFARDSYGAGKYFQQWTEGFKSVKGIVRVDSMSYTGTNISRIRLNWYCKDGRDLPVECQCPKKMKAHYRYVSQVQSSSQEKGSTWLYSRKAFNVVEDYGLFTSLNETTGEFKILDATLIKATTACDIIITPAYWNNWVDLTASIVKIFADQTTGNTLLGLTDSLILAQLKNIINTPYVVPTGCVTNNQKTIAMGGIKNLIIVNNQTLRLTLSSHDRSVSGGQRSWQSEGRILSNGYIATFLPGGRPFNNPDTACCTPIGSTWIASGAAEGFNPVPSLRADIANLIGLDGGWTFPIGPTGGPAVPTDYGYKWKPSSDPACAHMIYRESIGKESIQNIEVNIFDISGRNLLSTIVSQEQFELYQLNLAAHFDQFQPGTYFAVPSSNGVKMNPIKFVITK